MLVTGRESNDALRSELNRKTTRIGDCQVSSGIADAIFPGTGLHLNSTKTRVRMRSSVNARFRGPSSTRPANKIMIFRTWCRAVGKPRRYAALCQAAQAENR